MRQVREQIALFTPVGPQGIQLWANSATQELAALAQEFGFRLNRVAPLDGSENFTSQVTFEAGIIFDASGAAADERLWRLAALADGSFVLQTRTDAGGAGATPVSVTRTGTNVNTIDLAADAVNITSNIDLSGLIETAIVRLDERSAAVADEAGKGQLWVKNTTPNQLWFTDDAGTDHKLANVPADPNVDALLMWDDSTTATAWITEIPDSFLSANVPLLNVENTFVAGQTISAAFPFVSIIETDVVADTGFWRAAVSDGAFLLQTLTDAGGAGTNMIVASRTLTDVTSLAIIADAVNITSNVDLSGLIETALVRLDERSAAVADQAGKGQLWVKNTTPNQLWFTRDDGTEVQLS